MRRHRLAVLTCCLWAGRFGEALLLAQPSNPPTISGPSNLVVYPTAPPPVVALTVGDAETPADALVLTGVSSNTQVLESTNIVFGGAGSNRTATLNLTPGVVGTSCVTVAVTDLSGLSATNSLRLEVNYMSDVPPTFSGGNYFNARWADYVNDNRLDLFYGGFVYHNDGNGTFTQVASLGGANRNGVAWGDYDRDGELDLALGRNGIVQIYRNDGNGVFTDTGITLPVSDLAGLAWGDFDNDGL